MTSQDEFQSNGSVVDGQTKKKEVVVHSDKAAIPFVMSLDSAVQSNAVQVQGSVRFGSDDRIGIGITD